MTSIRRAIIALSFISFLLAGCVSIQRPYNTKIFEGSTEIVSYLPRESNYTHRWCFDGEWWQRKDIKYTWVQLDEEKKIGFAFKKYATFPMAEYRYKMYTGELTYIEFDWNFSCKNGVITTYWKIGEDGKDSIALGYSNLYSEYFGVETERWWELYGPKPFIRYKDGEKWGEREPYNFSGDIQSLDIVRYYLQGYKNASSSVRYGAFFGIETAKLLTNATAVCIEFIEEETKTGWSWGNPNNFSTYNPLVFINHKLWEEIKYNGTIIPGAMKMYAHDFSVYSTVKMLKVNLTYNQPTLVEDLDLRLFDAEQIIAESNRSAGEEEEIILREERGDFAGCTFGNWSIWIIPKVMLFLPVDYSGMIRVDY